MEKDMNTPDLGAKVADLSARHKPKYDGKES